MSHKSERDSSRKSSTNRATLRASEFWIKDVPSREEERIPSSDEELDATEGNEETAEVASLSQEETQVLNDLEALEMVLTELINRRTRPSETRSNDNLSPTSGSSSSLASDAKTERQSLARERQSIKLEEQLVQADVDRLDRFLERLDDQRAHGIKTPPADSTSTPNVSQRSTAASVIQLESLRDARLSHIVSIDDDIRNEIRKVDAELRKGGPKGSRKTGLVDTRRSRPSSLSGSQNASSRSTPQSSRSTSQASRSTSQTSRASSQTRKITEYGHNDEQVEFQGELPSWSSFEAFNVPSETSSVQTLPPSNTDLIVQYNPDFIGASPSTPMDPFIQRTIQRILDLKTTFPDDNLYLVPSSSIPAVELPRLSSLFEVVSSAHANRPISEEPSESLFNRGRTSTPDANTTASVERETLSNGAMMKRLGSLFGQTLLDYLVGAEETVESDAEIPNDPSDVPIVVAEKTVTDDHGVAPDKDVDEHTQKVRTVSLPEELNATPHNNNSQARVTSPALLSSAAVSSAPPEPARHVEVMPGRQSGVKATATSKQSEASDAALKSSLKTASTTQSTTVKQKPAASTDAVEPVSLATNLSSFVKKKVSFADMNSTMYIIVNASSEGLDTGSETGCCETKTGVAPATGYHGNDAAGATSRNTSHNSRPSSFCGCNPPRLTTSTPTSPLRPDVSSCCSRESQNRPLSMETMADLTPSFQAITGSITHVISRARSSAEQGRAICGSRDRWVTRVNSRSLSFASDNAICPSCRSESFHSNASDCCSLQEVCPPSSDEAVLCRQNASCSNCIMNRNCSCSETGRGGGEESDSQAQLVKEHTSTEGSSPGETADEGGSVSSLGHSGIAAASAGSDCENSDDVCSTVSVVFNVRDRKRTKNKSSEI